MRKIFTFFGALLVASIALAGELFSFEVNGIRYFSHATENSASRWDSDSEKWIYVGYSETEVDIEYREGESQKILNSAEELVIPATVSYGGKTYKVVKVDIRNYCGQGDGDQSDESNWIWDSTKTQSIVVQGPLEYFYVCGIQSLQKIEFKDTISKALIDWCYNLKSYKGQASFLQYTEKIFMESIIATSGEVNKRILDNLSSSYGGAKEIDFSACELRNLPDLTFNDCYKLESIKLPANLETIGYKAFAGCTALKSIIIPATVTTIDNSAFEDCRKLESVSFDGSELKASTSNLQTIGDWAFYNCHNLKSLEIPEGVTSVGDAAFYGCTYLQDLELPSTLKSLGDNCFALCENLQSITVLAEEPPSLYEKSFYNVNHSIPVSVTASSLKAYSESEYWNEFFNYKEAEIPNNGDDNGENNNNGDKTAISSVDNINQITVINEQILVNNQAPEFVTTVVGQKIANKNLKPGVYFVQIGNTQQGVSVR